jgi:hypothetical protein
VVSGWNTTGEGARASTTHLNQSTGGKARAPIRIINRESFSLRIFLTIAMMTDR